MLCRASTLLYHLLPCALNPASKQHRQSGIHQRYQFWRILRINQRRHAFDISYLYSLVCAGIRIRQYRPHPSPTILRQPLSIIARLSSWYRGSFYIVLINPFDIQTTFRHSNRAVRSRYTVGPDNCGGFLSKIEQSFVQMAYNVSLVICPVKGIILLSSWVRLMINKPLSARRLTAGLISRAIALISLRLCLSSRIFLLLLCGQFPT